MVMGHCWWSCNGEVISDGVGREKGVEEDGVMNEADKSSTTRVSRTVLTRAA